MDIIEVKNLKNNLESTITDLLIKFEQESGTHVESISLNTELTMHLRLPQLLRAEITIII